MAVHREQDAPLDTVEVETAPNPRGSVIWFHGLGADGHDFEPIVPELHLPEVPLRFVFPHAPVRPVTINGDIPMRAWFDITSLDFDAEPDEAGIRASAGLAAALVVRENARGIPASRIVLAGFSQGGAVALHAGLRHPERLAGILALSTFLPLQESFDAEAHAANRQTPVFMAHGELDPLLPVVFGERTHAFLEARGYAVTWKTYAMPHAVCAAEVGEIRSWLAERVGGR